MFPYYLAIGMSYEQFWCDDPSLVIAYRRADDIKKRRMNEELWLSGVYMSEAIMSTIGNAFSRSKHEYPSEPKPITMAEVEARRERDERLKMERIKAKFTARALSINAQKGVGQ